MASASSDAAFDAAAESLAARATGLLGTRLQIEFAAFPSLRLVGERTEFAPWDVMVAVAGFAKRRDQQHSQQKFSTLAKVQRAARMH